ATRSVMEPRTQPKVTEEQRVAREVARALQVGKDHNEFAALAVVAPPKFAGMLRHDLDEKLRRRIVQTVERDYTSLPPAQITRRLADTMKVLRARARESA